MTKALLILKGVANLLLSIGLFGVFNENPDNFVPNFVGLACFILLIVINRKNNYGRD